MTIIKKAAKRSRNRAQRGDANRQHVEKYAGDAYSLAKRTWTGLNEIRKLINIEEKYLDSTASQSPDTNGTLTCITQMAQGVTLNTRVGNSIRVQRLSLIGRAGVSGAVTTYSLVRILVFRDMEGQGTAPTMADVLESVGSSGAPRQPYDYLNRKRFSILADWLYPLTLVSGGQGMVQTFNLDLELVKHTLFRGTTAAATSDGEGSIYVGCVSDEATNTPNVTWTSRITFTDD